ncbi:unnamed protein product [Gongylonema pulchrum]|uniref:DUF1563 domain-containing protein n=1 Tax=Gongylonema pulchrum TaxID=637853 RepID=A0A183E8S6_9BILA|nr:unnamed protein product [Gongylonema pulchrum]
MFHASDIIVFQWLLFRLAQLEQFDNQLMKLYKKEGIGIANMSDFGEINREIARRQQKFMKSENSMLQ